MSRRRLNHGKAARTLVREKLPNGTEIEYAVRGDVEKWRAERGIVPHGKRPKDGSRAGRAQRRIK